MIIHEMKDPEKIRNELLKYIKKNKVFNIGNRKLAIKAAIQNATYWRNNTCRWERA